MPIHFDVNVIHHTVFSSFSVCLRHRMVLHWFFFSFVTRFLFYWVSNIWGHVNTIKKNHSAIVLALITKSPSEKLGSMIMLNLFEELWEARTNPSIVHYRNYLRRQKIIHTHNNISEYFELTSPTCITSLGFGGKTEHKWEVQTWLCSLGWQITVSDNTNRCTDLCDSDFLWHYTWVFESDYFVCETENIRERLVLLVQRRANSKVTGCHLSSEDESGHRWHVWLVKQGHILVKCQTDAI